MKRASKSWDFVHRGMKNQQFSRFRLTSVYRNYLQMNKVFFFLLFLATGVVKANGQSMLKVSLRDNSTQISVSVDDRHFNKRGTSITVGELPYGVHYLKIFAMEYTRRGRGYEEVIYSGRVKTYNGMITLFVFDPETGEPEVKDMDIDAYTANHPMGSKGKFMPGDQQDGGNDTAGNITLNNNDNIAEPTSPVASPVSSDKFGTLTDAKMAQLKKTSGTKQTDTQKMTMLKDELKKEKLTTNQVSDFMDLFSFESSKVEFAKWAYQLTVDKEYYIDLESKFAYKTSQDDFDKFLKGQN
jgi:hypothetical protein